MAEKKLKVLTLSIKQKFFDEILAGTKTHEYRDAWATNIKKFLYFAVDGETYEFGKDNEVYANAETIEYIAKEYDAIKFYTGAYSGKRPWMLVEVKDVAINVHTDENDESVWYEYDNGITYNLIHMDYTLGKVLDKDLNPQ